MPKISDSLTRKKGNLSLPKSDGGYDKIDIIWRPSQKEAIDKFAEAKGKNYQNLIRQILKQHLERAAKRQRQKPPGNWKEALKKMAGKEPVASYIRTLILEYLEKNPITNLPEAPPESSFPLLKELRPEAIVYTVPINGAKIVASNNPEGGWKGLVYNPEKTGSTAAWSSQNLTMPEWAQSRSIIRALLFINSRIDDWNDEEKISYFQAPESKYKISAVWNDEEKNWKKGEIIGTDGRRQVWSRAGWYSIMEPGPFNLNAPLRRLQNMLCRAITVGNGGMETKVPLN